jgi:hypothetical protein
MRGLRILIGFTTILAGGAIGQGLDQRDKLAGSWQATDGKNGEAVWTLEETGGRMRLKNTVGGKTMMEAECTPNGKECSSKDDGKSVTLTMWFNGPKLVVMEVHGSDVSKRRFEASPDGTSLNVETLSINPPAQAEVSKFKRLEIASDRR